MIERLRVYSLKTAIVLSLLTGAMAVHAVEIMRWERMPLAVPLHVGQERVIFVDSNVRVGVPSSLDGKLRVQSASGTLYLLALEPIPPTRIQLQDAQTGALILMDIAASIPSDNTPPLETVQIIEGDHTPVRYGRNHSDTGARQEQTQNRAVIEVNGNATTLNHEAQQRETPAPVILTRYAAQNLYAPLRTVEPHAGISRVNLNRNLNLQTLLPMLFVEVRLLAAWRLEDYWVTAISLKNTSQQVIHLDPRLLQGDFVAVTFQHATLGAAGNSTDTTVVYLITHQHGLAESLLPALSQINATRNIRRSGGHDEK